ncbi:peptide methionine sulfoxide reductase [Listeria monocytogenes]|uniref:peptide methionine sulfoxide reductase n=1 Tax=Listeria monocytogenes TaxID=1639 RepID=UPI000F1B701B|nr:peptide methionine sulfoxide reductase [Listeria monocytogenes]EAD0738589.1 peptide methionine sulfoxide reductase [Listeria monocytogenes]EAG1758619.1 peptide methionine sulfoxide reductase [Listeria monocytogenes]MCN73764.1 peptide methionine sulfoxide reductase [Listeria monocytogenes]TYU88925.1 peptide methionine sulfoxide reductase [Listeria monocytogenes]
MLFKRYGNPLDLLRTYRIVDLTDFILYLQDTEQEERVYNQWLHTQMTQSFKEFKKQQNIQSVRKKKVQVTSKEAQQAALDYAFQFVKPNQPIKSEVE